MTNLLDHYDHYKILGVAAGAGIADVTTSYRRLCHVYHPDVNDDPESEELMKRINIAYAALREKLTREAAFRDRQVYARPVRRPQGADTHTRGAEERTGPWRAEKKNTTESAAEAAAAKEAFSALDNYFMLINACDYSGAYNYLSNIDKQFITRESFVQWRKSVARLYPMRGYIISGGQTSATVTFKDGRTLNARKFRVAVTEDNFVEETVQRGDVEKIVINENSPNRRGTNGYGEDGYDSKARGSNGTGSWKVFLGYKSVGELTRSFDEKYETKRKHDLTKRWEEYYTGLSREFDMLSLAGMRKTFSREMYRQRRFGGALSFTALSIKTGGASGAGQDELLRSAARTITAALRETDVTAYAGDGVFAILFVELRKKNIEEIVDRLIGKIRKDAGAQLGGQARIEHASGSWTGRRPADMDAINKILRKFRKKV